MAVSPGTTPFRKQPEPMLRGRQRRLRTLLTTGITVLAVTATIVIANVVSERYHLRFDATAAGTQRLAPRTDRLLSRLGSRMRVVIATDLKGTEQRSKDRVRDVLAEMKRSSRYFDYTLIDTASVSGLETYKALIRELAARDQKLIDEQTGAAGRAELAAQSLGNYLTGDLSPALLGVQAMISDATPVGQNNRAYFEQAAAGVRLLAQDLAAGIGHSKEALGQTLDDIPIPATDRAAQALIEPLTKSVDQLTELATQLARFADATGAGANGKQARELIPQVSAQRDQAAVILDGLRRMNRLDLLRMTDVLKTGNAALVVGPANLGLAAMDLDSLLPSGAYLEATGMGKADLSRRVEELVTTAIAALLNPVRPIVVLTHAERPLFDQPQIVERNFGAMRQRLLFRGIDLLEWAATVDPAPPKLAELNPGDKRPVVYLTFPAESTEGGDTKGSTGVQRATKMGEVINALVLGGKNVLLTANPCILQTYGQPDPIAPALEHFGLVVESGRPLLWDQVSRQGRRVETEHAVMPEENSGSLPSAIMGLRMLLPGPVAFHEHVGDSKEPITLWRLYSIPASDRVWSESQWLQLWQTPRDQRALMPNQPVFDDGRDVRWPQGMMGQKEQSWLVAAAVERRPARGAPQRLVTVGSREWFSNKAVEPRVSIDGRTAMVSPGNLELLEASVYWLANQDELIAQSATAQTIPLIQPIDVKVLSGLRLTMIVGLPLGVLALGLVYRLLRG